MKIKTFLLGMAMLLGIASALAQGGTTGPLTWNIEKDTLTISGIGEMPNYNQGIYCIPFCAPWTDYRHRITSIIIEEGVTNIGGMAFFYCYRLSSINIPNSVTRIEASAFNGCGNLKSIDIPNSVTSIGGAFYGCGLISIIIPNNVSDIGDYTFGWCKNLTAVTIPNSVLDIGYHAFERCSVLDSFTNLNPVPQIITPDVFIETNISACTLYVPMASVAAYQAAEVWKEFNIVGIDVGIDEMGTGNPLLIYPNPTTGYCTITIPDEFLHEPVLTLLVYDISGRLIREIPVENDGEKFSMNLGLKAQGTYMTVLSNGKKSYRGKVVFE